MKKVFRILLVLSLVLTAMPVCAESNTGIWGRYAYVDEFKQPTDDYYVRNAKPIIGTFSNSATTDSELAVYLLADEGDIFIMLMEYGNQTVKNSSSSLNTYEVIMQAPDNQKYTMTGYLSSGTDRIHFVVDDSNTIYNALRMDGTVRFAITDKDRPTTTYVFSIDDTTGFEEAFPYTRVGYNGSGLFYVMRDGRYGLIDVNGNVVTPCIYARLGKFSDEGLAQVGTISQMRKAWGLLIPDQYGFIDTTGKVVIPLEYKLAYGFSEGLACVAVDGKYGCIDIEGNIVVPCRYDNLLDFHGGLSAVSNNDDKYGFMNVAGEVVIPYEYDHASYFSEGYVAVRKGEKYGFIDTTNNPITEFIYDYYGRFEDGLAYVRLNDKCGFINTTGELVIPCEYDSVSRYQEGMVGVKLNDKWGFINATGELVIPCEYDAVDWFCDGFATVRINDKYGVIDANGTIIIPCEYDSVAYGEGHFAMVKDGKLTIIPCEDI